MGFSGMTSQSISPGAQFVIIPASAMFWHMSAVKPIRKMSKNVPITKLKLMELRVWEKRDAHAGNEWDSSGLWANARGHPDVFTGLLYYSEYIYVSMMHGRND